MIKLYKRQPTHIQYWETWEKEGQTCVHFGRVGERGETLWFPPAQREAIAARLERDIASLRDTGYETIEDDDHVELVLQYRIARVGTTADLSRRHKVEELIDECLGWTGNGRCDGGDVGSGTTNVFCFVIDPVAALEAVVTTLRREGLLEGVVIAHATEEEDEYQVLWPVDFSGRFSLL